jgi:hypothetical protein
MTLKISIAEIRARVAERKRQRAARAAAVRKPTKPSQNIPGVFPRGRLLRWRRRED